MTTNLAESFNAWLRNERHHSICSFIIKHMTKSGAMLVKHKAESNAWKGIIGLKIEEKGLLSQSIHGNLLCCICR